MSVFPYIFKLILGYSFKNNLQEDIYNVSFEPV